MTKKIDKISGFDRILLQKLNTVKGFFLYGNRIRFTTNLPMDAATLIYALEKKPGSVIEDIIEDSIGSFADILQWDGKKDFWFAPDDLLLCLGTKYRFYNREEAEREDLKFSIIKEYPFVVINQEVPSGYAIPVELNGQQITIGIGSSAALLSHTPIPKTVRKLLKKIPTII